MELSLETLVQLAQEGDQEAFAELVRRHYGMVHGIAFGRTSNWQAAEDIAQDVFLRTYEALALLKHRRSFPMWLRSIARNCSISWIRQNAKHTLPPSQNSQTDEKTVHVKHDPVFTASCAECRGLLQQHAANLSPKHREALTMHYFEGFSVLESAAALGISQDTFKKRLRRARKGMKKSMTSDEKNPELEEWLPYSREERTRAILVVLPAIPGQTPPEPGVVSLAWEHLRHGGGLAELKHAGIADRLCLILVLWALVPATIVAGILWAAGALDTNASDAQITVGDPEYRWMGWYAGDRRDDPNHGDDKLARSVLKGYPADKDDLEVSDGGDTISGDSNDGYVAKNKNLGGGGEAEPRDEGGGEGEDEGEGEGHRGGEGEGEGEGEEKGVPQISWGSYLGGTGDDKGSWHCGGF